MKTANPRPIVSLIRSHSGFAVGAVSLLVFLLASVPLHAQESTLAGTVMNEGGKALKEAEITLANDEDSAIVLTTVSDKKGAFKLKIAAPGTYTLTIARKGYGPYTTSLEVEPSMDYTTEGIKLYDEKVWQEKRAVDAYNEGVEALSAGDMDEAEERFKEALTLNPELVQVHAGLAASYAHQERWEDAAASLDIFLAALPDHAPIYSLAFDAYRKTGQDEKAAEVLSKVTDENELAQMAVPIYNEAVTMSKAGDPEGAFAGFQKASEIAPHLPEPYRGMAAIRFNEENFAEALVHAEELLKRDPESLEGLRMQFYATRAVDGEGFADALAAYLGAAPAAEEDIVRQAADEFEAGHSDIARKTFEAILDFNPEAAEAHFRLGMVLASDGDSAGAKAHLQQFLDMAPDHKEASTARAMLEGL